MKLCPHCGGDLLRHGITTYKHAATVVGVRYRCRDCRKSFTKRVERDQIRGVLFFNDTGRPTLKDWRFASETDRGTPCRLLDGQPREGLPFLSPALHRLVAEDLRGCCGGESGIAGQRALEGR